MCCRIKKGVGALERDILQTERGMGAKKKRCGGIRERHEANGKRHGAKKKRCGGKKKEVWGQIGRFVEPK